MSPQAELLARCTFPPPGTAVACALSGGPDSTALVALAVAAGCHVTTHHVDHGLRPTSVDDAAIARNVAEMLGVTHREHRIRVDPGPNLEARAREARLASLPDGVLTGHTADDQAETVLIRLLRGAGGDGLTAMAPGDRRPLLALRRFETRSLCRALQLPVADDPTNHDPVHLRNRVRHEVLPLLADVAGRDVVPLLTRTADLLRDDAEVLAALAADLDPTDARALAHANPAIARRAVRRWLTIDGYPPDAASVERVLAVARGECLACEITGGRRIERSSQRLRLTSPTR